MRTRHRSRPYPAGFERDLSKGVPALQAQAPSAIRPLLATTPRSERSSAEETAALAGPCHFWSLVLGEFGSATPPPPPSVFHGLCVVKRSARYVAVSSPRRVVLTLPFLAMFASVKNYRCSKFVLFVFFMYCFVLFTLYYLCTHIGAYRQLNVLIRFFCYYYFFTKNKLIIYFFAIFLHIFI